jgi:hypothetical protein
MKTRSVPFFLMPPLLVGLILISAVEAEAQSSCTPPPSGLLSWFPMQNSVTDIAGEVLVLDTSDLSFVPGEVGQGVTFGTGGYIDLTNCAALETPEFTWEAWVRWDGPGPNEDFAGSVILESTLSASSAYGLAARASDNRFVFVADSNGSTTVSLMVSSNTFTPGLFYHVAVSYDGANFNLYVNGSLQGQLASASSPTWGPIWSIGANPAFARNDGYPRTWNGVIDEVSIYNRALSATEIQAIYNAGGAGKCITPQLTISLAGTNVILTWPANATAGFALQSATNLGSTNWSTNLPSPVVVSGQNTVTNPIFGTQNFFRLANP